jgi:hypothetical protein
VRSGFFFGLIWEEAELNKLVFIFHLDAQMLMLARWKLLRSFLIEMEPFKIN